jgi:hypothetical protein
VAVELGLVAAVIVGVQGSDLARCGGAAEVDVAAAALVLAVGKADVSAEPESGAIIPGSLLNHVLYIQCLQCMLTQTIFNTL